MDEIHLKTKMLQFNHIKCSTSEASSTAHSSQATITKPKYKTFSPATINRRAWEAIGASLPATTTTPLTRVQVAHKPQRYSNRTKVIIIIL